MKTLRSKLHADDDAALISRLRDGDHAAYTELWRRHVTAALRLGNRIVPGQAEDLVSESFLAVYQQITVSGKGPETYFRAYLFTVMRNTAQRWQQEQHRLVTTAEIDLFEELAEGTPTPLDLLEKESTSAELLDALTSLPERWQRILWLTEVEDASRTQIARDLGIKPNAVSALQKRARTGLRMTWLTLRIPKELREDAAHAAHLIPRLIVDGRASGIGHRVNVHLRECDACAKVNADLVASYRQLKKVTLSLAGFAALVGTTPAMAPPIAVGVAATVSLGVIATAIAASAGLIFVGGAVTTGLLEQKPAAATTSQAETDQPPSKTSNDEGGTNRDSDSSKREEASDSVTALGRHNTDPGIPSVDFSENAYGSRVAAQPAPVRSGTVPEPKSDDVHPAISPGLDTPAASNGYLAPTLSGHTQPNASVAIRLLSPPTPSGTPLSPTQYLATVDSLGTWSFRFPDLTNPGTYSYEIWAYTTTDTSPASTGTFTISTPVVRGFEGLVPLEAVPLAEANSSGFVIQVTGRPSGTVCLTSVHADQTAIINLDASGSATRRLRLLAGGPYYLTFQACTPTWAGPSYEVLFDVEDPDAPIFGPWGPDPAGTSFELSEL